MFKNLAMAGAMALAGLAPFGAVNASVAKVSYSDLNLGSAQGRAVLNSRLERAASRVCRADVANDFANQVLCRRFALSDARKQVKGVLLSARLFPEPVGAR